MVVNTIKVYARIKQDSKAKGNWYDIIKKGDEFEDLKFKFPEREPKYGNSNFRFYQIFDEGKDQRDIFDVVAKPVVTSVLQGYNGTIFAYGQTGSGKTYTMTGSTSKYEERGIIPRSLQHIFATIEKTEVKPTLYISYLEIYNEIGYDLLSPRNSKTATILEELPRITVLEDRKGEPHLRNLSVLPISTEEEAMRLLFLGETNRAIAETPLNEYSSRSHCIFTIYITSRGTDTQSMFFAKLNLVDLAGSERVYKSQITGNTLTEAKHINLSLHFLQQVILALSQSRRSHIPYRNSLMTFILKDSLAGNCLTVMLATLAISRKNLQESISTCRFAQRVSLIRTDAVINEVSDPYQEILLLKNEVQELRKELANRKPIMLLQENTSISNKQKEEIDIELDMYLNSNENLFKANLDPGLYQYCFSFFKNKIKCLEKQLKDKEDVLYSVEKPSAGKRPITANDQDDGNLFDSSNIEDVQQQMNSTGQKTEVDYYLKLLSGTYKKAKHLAEAIDVCQVNIGYIREKLDIVTRAGDYGKKILLSKQLEQQQRIYRKSLMELKELKNETMQLEAGLNQAKTKGIRSSGTSMEIWKDNQVNRNMQDTHTACYKNDIVTSKIIRSSVVDIENEGYCSKCFDEHQMLSDDNFWDSEDLYMERCYLPPINNASRKTDYVDKRGRIPNWSKQNSDARTSCCCSHNTDYIENDDYLKYAKTLDICHRNGNNFHCSTKRNVPESNYCEFEDNKYCKGCFKSQPAVPSILCDSIDQPLCQQTNDHHILPSKYLNISRQRSNKTKDLLCQCEKINIRPNTECQSSEKSCSCTQYNSIECENNYLNQLLPYMPRRISKTKKEHLKNFTKSQKCENNNCLGTENNAPNLLSASLKNNPNYLANQLIPDKLCRSASETDLQQELHDSIYNNTPPNSQEFVTNSSTIRINDCVLRLESGKECQKIRNSNSNTETLSDSIFFDTDTEDFKKFMDTVHLTGDIEVDKEICMFYRTKMCS